MDYSLAPNLSTLLPSLFDGNESATWAVLNQYAGGGLKRAEDAFVSKMARKYWQRLASSARDNPFHVISARRAIRILQQNPERTPGIGLKAWGTGASAEVNVHVSIREETTDWSLVKTRIVSNGIRDIINAVGRKRMGEVFDPEI